MKLTFFGKCTELSLKFNKSVYFFIIVIVLFGSITFQGMTKSIFPIVKFPYVSVYTGMMGASADDVEEMITTKIEEVVRDSTDIMELKSTSSQGSSLIILKFREGVDNSQKVQEIQSKVNNILNELPKQADKPIVEAYDITKFPIFLIDIPGNKPYFQQMEIINELKHKIKRVEGISKIEVTGINKPRVNIYPNIQQMERYGISNAELISIVEDAGLDIPLGETELNGMNYSFQTDNQIKSLEELEELVVIHYQSQVVKMKDLARVEYVDEVSKARTYRVKDGERTPIVNLQVYKDKEADTVAINRQVKEVVEAYNKSHPFSKVDYSMDLSVYISKSIQDVANNALGGLLSVVVVLFLFIHLREAIIASLVIPLTLIGSVILFKPFGLSMNIFTIMGLIIALGMLVDNAIVVIEMIDEGRKKHKNITFKDVVLTAANKVGEAIFSSTLTTICAFIPLAFLSGEDGAIIRVIPIAMAIAMSLSFIVSISVTPVLAYTFLKKTKEDEPLFMKIGYIVIVVICSAYAFSNNWKLTGLSFVAAFIVAILSIIKIFKPFKSTIQDNRFLKLITTVLHAKGLQALILIGTLMMFLYSISLLTGGKIPNESMPEVDSQALTGTVSLIKGSRLEDSMEIYEDIEAFLSEKDYIKQYSVTVSKDKQTYYIELRHKSERGLHSKYILDELRNYVNAIPDVKGTFNVDGEESGIMPIIIRLYGDEQKDLIEESKKVEQILKNIQGVVSPQVNYAYGNPTVSLKIDKELVSRMNVDISDVLLQLRYLIAGEKISTIKVDEESVKVYLKYNQPLNNLLELAEFKIANKDGVMVPFDALIETEEKRSISEVYHFDSKKMISVSSNYDNTTSVEQIIVEFKQMLAKQGGLNEGVSYEIAGDYVAMNESYSDMVNKFMIALLLVYFVLLLQFNSYLQPFAIILCVPFSIIGVALGYYFTGLTFSTLTFLGIVSLVGIAINDAIVLIDYINNLRKNGMPRVEAIIMGCESRFKPIIATSLTTIAGVLPLALYSEDYSQMAYALIFGLCSSTLLTLFVVPCALNALEGIVNLLKKGRNKNVEEY